MWHRERKSDGRVKCAFDNKEDRESSLGGIERGDFGDSK